MRSRNPAETTSKEFAPREQTRADHNSNVIPSYYDNWVNRQSPGGDMDGYERLARHQFWRGQGRFVSWELRRSVALDGLDPARRSEIPDEVLIMSQGIAEVMQWRGLGLYKNVFDYALLPMLLADLRPAILLEVGSGTGASALWLADIAVMQQLQCSILSVDIAPVMVEHSGIRFVQADARNLGVALPDHWSDVGPRLVVEDAHVGVGEVLAYADRHLRPGDYLVIEDSVRKAETISAFLEKRPSSYAVDTRYTDFFGRNATSCVDSIFKKMQ